MTMTIPISSVGAWAFAVAVVCLPVGAAAQSPERSSAPKDGLAAAARGLRSDRADERGAAYQRLRQDRSAAITELMSFVAANASIKTGEADGSLHYAMRALGDLNATQARRLLLSMIEFRVKLPHGAKYPMGSEWPAAYALAHISGDDVAVELVAHIADEPKPLRRRLITWVMYRSLGATAAAAELGAAATRGAIDADKRERLGRAKSDVLLGDQLVSEAPAVVE